MDKFCFLTTLNIKNLNDFFTKFQLNHPNSIEVIGILKFMSRN